MTTDELKALLDEATPGPWTIDPHGIDDCLADVWTEPGEDEERICENATVEDARLIAADCEPHIRLAILLMLTTAARVGAVLDLTWDRVDMERGQINLRVDQEGPRKGRAVVPINGTLRAALTAAAVRR